VNYNARDANRLSHTEMVAIETIGLYATERGRARSRAVG
jgi:hypothetical protein